MLGISRSTDSLHTISIVSYDCTQYRQLVQEYNWFMPLLSSPELNSLIIIELAVNDLNTM